MLPKLIKIKPLRVQMLEKAAINKLKTRENTAKTSKKQ